ncbi:MAG: hypothetical protein JSV71_01250 [Nitrospiraceae bacterium]|nr:MAG: hypothetical protein JSV71_01250 [Nitrospiraceae bacterium]
MRKLNKIILYLIIVILFIISKYVIYKSHAQDYKVPENAYISGNNWYCKSGYYRFGNKCLDLSVPENAYISGKKWYCKSGYKLTGNKCRELTATEIDQKKVFEQKYNEKILQRSSQKLSRDDCEKEYKSNARVCVTVTDASLDCRESYNKSFIQNCDVEVYYEVSTDYNEDNHLDVGIKCSAKINYKKGDSNSWNSYSDHVYKNYKLLFSNNNVSDNMSVHFYFGSNKEVTNAKIDSVECKINSVNHLIYEIK